MSLVDIVTFPYVDVASRLAGNDSGSLSSWLSVWLGGTWAIVAALIAARVVVFYLCDWLGNLTVYVYRSADRGARLHQRRRNARWSVGVSRVLRSIKRPTGIYWAPVGDALDTERITPAQRFDAQLRAVVLLTESVVSFLGAATRSLCSWFGLYSIAGATWATHRRQFQQASTDFLTYALTWHVPVNALALAFAVGTFILANAVSWRRRGLSKWRTDYTVEGFERLNTIRVNMADMLREIGPAIGKWHSAMATSWSHATSSSSRAPIVRRRLGDTGPWQDAFDALHESWEVHLGELEKTTNERHRIAIVLAATPWTVRPVIFHPRIFLGVQTFSPSTHKRIDEMLNAASITRRRYRSVLRTALGEAYCEVNQGITNDLHHHLDSFVDDVLSKSSPGAVEQYRETLDSVVGDAAHCFVTALRRHLMHVDLSTLVRFDEGQSVSNRYRHGLDAVISRLPLILKQVFELELNPRALEAMQVRCWERDQFWVSLGQPPPSGNGHSKVIDACAAAALGGALRKASSEVDRQLDSLLEGCTDERSYQNFMDGCLRSCCETEAELIDCLRRLDRFLIPRGRWAQMRAALSR